MKKIYIITIVVFSIVIRFNCWATTDSGKESYFLGFMGKKQDHALVMVCNIQELEPETDLSGMIFSVKMNARYVGNKEKIEIVDSSNNLMNAYMNGNYKLLWYYYNSKSNKKFPHYFISAKNSKKLPPIEIPENIQNNEKKLVDWKKSAKFSTQSSELTVSVKRIHTSNKGHLIAPELKYDKISFLGEAFISQTPPPGIFYFYNEKIPYNIDAYMNKTGQIIVVGSFAHEPELNGTFYPIIGVHPINNH